MLPYSPDYAFTATRSFALNGREYVAGEVIDKTGISRARLQQLYSLRRIAPVAPVAVTREIAAIEPTPEVMAIEPNPGDSAGGFMEPTPSEITPPLDVLTSPESARRSRSR